MILDSPLTLDMTEGSGRRVVQAGDAQLVVPAVVNPVVFPMRFTRPDPDPTVLHNLSFNTYSELSRTNQAALSDPICRMAPGMWEIQMNLALWANFTVAAGLSLGADIDLLYTSPVTGVSLLTLYPIIGAQSIFGTMRILLQTEATIRIFAPITGAAQSLNVTASINGIRLF